MNHYNTTTLPMAYVKLNFEGKSKSELLRIRENAVKHPENEYLVQAVSLIDIVLQEMDRFDYSESEEETESEAESSESESEEETESECEETESENED